MEENKGAAEMVDRKLKVGDKVRVVEYGHLMFRYKKCYQEESDMFAKLQIDANNKMAEMLFGSDYLKEDSSNAKGNPEPDNIYKDCGDMWWIDINHSIVGQEGVVCEVTNTQGRLQYAVDGIKGKHAWYDEKQLELVKTDSADRKEGYYWVRYTKSDEFEVAKWWPDEGDWTRNHYEMEYGDEDFYEIDERQICRS
tara:strand:+ start:2191 stop:2778 length:588 start_codon:yes stop_codon:yes gene_type:complete